MKNRVISLFGSSIMEGVIGVEPHERWHEVMRRRLAERFPEVYFAVENGAVGGESTRECMKRFDRDVLAFSPDYLLVMVGGNNEDYTRPERLVSLEEIRRHMEDMIARLPGKTRVIGVGVGPIINEWHWAAKHPAFAEPFRQCGGGLDELFEPQRELARRFFREGGYPFLDLYPLFDRERRHYLLPDGIHLNRHGHKLFGRKMFSMLEKEMTERVSP